MSTRSNICLKHKDNSYTVVYCHWDGYPSNNGKLLFENYNTIEKVKELLSHGDISSLGENIGIKHPFDRPSRPWAEKGTKKYEKEMKVYTDFMALYENMTTFYGRDRNESDCESKHYRDYEELTTMLEDSWTEWVYIFDESISLWYYTNNPSPTWFKCCGEQRQIDLLTPEAWKDEKD